MAMQTGSVGSLRAPRARPTALAAYEPDSLSSLGICCDPAGDFVREIVVGAALARELCSTRHGLAEALVERGHAVTVDLSGCRQRREIQVALGCLAPLRERYPGAPAWRFQLSPEQALDPQLRALMSSESVSVILPEPSYACPSLLDRIEAPRGWSVAISGSVHSVCPALGSEAATVVTPCSGSLVPVNAAVLTVHLDVGSCDGSDLAIQAAAADTVVSAERALDRLRWPTAAHSADAFQNRRLALIPQGLGDYVRAAGADPADPATLRRLIDLLRAIRRGAEHASREAAERAGPFPAMQARQVFAHLRGRPDFEPWHRRWERVTLDARYRHRHLLFVSIESLWPAADRRAAGFERLLPAIATADGLCLGRGWGAVGADASARARILRMAHAALHNPRPGPLAGPPAADCVR